MPLNDLASFIFYTYKDFQLAAEETNGLHMKLQYWDFFFFLLQLLWTQTKYFSGLKCSVDNRIKAERPHHGRS